MHVLSMRRSFMLRTLYFDRRVCIARFLCAMRVLDVRKSSSPLVYLCAKFCFCSSLPRCWASPSWKIAYYINHSVPLAHSITHRAYLMPPEPKLSLRNISTKLRQIPISSCSALARTDKQTDTNIHRWTDADKTNTCFAIMVGTQVIKREWADTIRTQ